MRTEPLPGLTPAQTDLLRRLSHSALWVTDQDPYQIVGLERALADAGLQPLNKMTFTGDEPATAVCARLSHVAALGRHDMGYQPINTVIEKGPRL